MCKITHLGGWWVGQTRNWVKQHPMPTSAIATQHHSYHHHPSLPTNTTIPPPQTPTRANPHWCHQPQASTTASLTIVGGSVGFWQWGAWVVSGGDGWRQLMAPVGGSGGLQGEKTSKKNFVPNELKSPKNNMSFFVFSTLGGWVGQKQVCNFTHFFFWTLPLETIY